MLLVIIVLIAFCIILHHYYIILYYIILYYIILYYIILYYIILYYIILYYIILYYYNVYIVMLCYITQINYPNSFFLICDNDVRFTMLWLLCKYKHDVKTIVKANHCIIPITVAWTVCESTSKQNV